MQIKGINEDIKGILFDLDGLLVNSERLYWQANIQAAEEANLGTPRDAYLHLTGASVKEMQAFYHKYFKTAAERDRFIKRTDDLVWQWTDQGKLKLQPGVKEALQCFHQRRVPMAIVSSNYQKVVLHDLRVTGVGHYFAFYLSYANVQAEKMKPKPAPDIYLAAAKKMNLPKENLLVFEDSATGVAAAYNANLKVVMIPDLIPASERDRRQASLVCPDFFAFLRKI